MATSTTWKVPSLILSCTSTPRGQTVIRSVIGAAPHHRSLAVSTTAPESSTDSIRYGPEDGNLLSVSASIPGLRSQVVFQASATRPISARSPPCRALVTSRPSWSAMTWEGITEVAVNNWL